MKGVKYFSAIASAVCQFFDLDEASFRRIESLGRDYFWRAQGLSRVRSRHGSTEARTELLEVNGNSFAGRIQCLPGIVDHPLYDDVTDLQYDNGVC